MNLARRKSVVARDGLKVRCGGEGKMSGVMVAKGPGGFKAKIIFHFGKISPIERR